MADNKYLVEIIDGNYYRRQISCQNACPVHTDAQGYVNAIACGDLLEGYIMARQPNPFASTCGRVCNAPCESECRRGNIDAPISIRSLKRFLCERYGVESKEHLAIARAPGEARGTDLLTGLTPGNSNTTAGLDTLLRAASANRSGRRQGKVAVIGSGPAGITAAHDLAALGHVVTVFEAASAPGGMLLLGIPEYRLPRSLIRFEIDDILRLGVELRLNSRLGQDFDISDLKREGFDAVFIAIGAYLDRVPDMPGSDLAGVIYSLDFLREANLGYGLTVGTRVLVVGGGGTAIDAARTMLRMGDSFLEKDGVAALDAARGALRLGAREVHIIYRGGRSEMRAPDEEVEDALEEGVHLHTSRAPLKILGEGGKVRGLETIRVQSSIDEQGKRVRTFVPGSEEVFEGDTLIVATGQGSDLSFIREKDGIEITKDQTIKVDPDTLATTASSIFAGGDVAFGPRIIIEAVKDGHKAALSIDCYIQSGRSEVVGTAILTQVPRQKLPGKGYLDIPRQRPPLLSLERRTGVSEVELAYDEASAIEQASRCLRCHIQTVFNGDLCILCGGCVDVCPYSCFKMVSLDRIEGDATLEAIVSARYGMALETFRMEPKIRGSGTAMIKDEDRCIRCGLCAERCPTGAITMEAFKFEEELVYRDSDNPVPALRE